MTLPNGRIWVNPEGVSQVGDNYAEHVELYQQYLDQLMSLRERYADSWGDDDMGKQFSKKFLGGMDNLENLIGGIKGTLNYTAEGLRESGKLYRDADDQAAEAGHQMASNFESTLPAVHAFTASRSTEGTTAMEAPRLMRAETVEGPQQGIFSSSMSQGEPVAGTEPTKRYAAVRTRAVRNPEAVPAPGEAVAPGAGTDPVVTSRSGVEPLQPATSAFMPAQPGIPALPLEPTGMMTSSHRMSVNYAGALIGGEPLPEGYRLETLNPLPDGTTRVDANRYDSITPINAGDVTSPDGQPIDSQGGQFVVVKDNPNVDPLANGYQPTYLGFNPDGTPIGLLAGQ